MERCQGEVYFNSGQNPKSLKIHKVEEGVPSQVVFEDFTLAFSNLLLFF